MNLVVIFKLNILSCMENLTKDLCSLGLQPLDALGFNSEEELLDALVPLMDEIEIEQVLIA